jgi:ABC-type spermidine/putrescine transport system permease subunit II
MVRFGVTPDVNAVFTIVVLISITHILISQKVGGGPRSFG